MKDRLTDEQCDALSTSVLSSKPPDGPVRWYLTQQDIRALIRAAYARGREGAAKVCDRIANDEQYSGYWDGANECAAAIRGKAGS